MNTFTYILSSLGEKKHAKDVPPVVRTILFTCQAESIIKADEAAAEFLGYSLVKNPQISVQITNSK